MIESEIKIPVPDLEPIRLLLQREAAEMISPLHDEVNILFDTDDGALAAGGKVLRVRRIDRTSILTFKGPATWVGAVKQRQEIELEVSSSGTISELLHALGYAPWMRYEKKRESWVIDDVRIELDHTPMGDFVELEGRADRLEDAAERLGLDPSSAATGSYISLWQDYRESHPDLGRDMVFDP
jgi:adenylate cyclase class 2